MILFWSLAGLMILASVAAVVVPMLRSRRNAGTSGLTPAVSAGAIAGVLVVPLLALALYNSLTNWDWSQADAVAEAGDLPSVQQMVAGLERRLQEGQGELRDWLMLGRSFIALGEFEKARDAYATAYELDQGATPGVTVAYAEALIRVDPSQMAGLAGDLLEDALAKAPDDQKALWYGGMAAYQRQEWALAAERWTRLRDSGAPEQVQQLLSERIRELEERIGGTAQMPVTTATAAVTQPAAGDRTSVQLDVSIVPELASQVDGTAPLFIIARNPTAPGPPLAVVRRRSGELPLQVELSDADAMIPGTKLSNQGELKLVARVALGGGPLPQTGDLFGEIQYRFADGSPVALKIDRVVP